MNPNTRRWIAVSKRFQVWALALAVAVVAASPAQTQDVEAKEKTAVFVRFKVTDPQGERFTVKTGGMSHGGGGTWTFPVVAVETNGGAWSEWIDLGMWSWGGLNKPPRSGGVAEWQSMTLSVARTGPKEDPIQCCALEVQIADKPDEKNAVHSFTERSATATIGFLVPYPLREHAKEFETGSQMAARHLAWAKEATGDKPITLKKFNVISSVGHYDSALARQEYEVLRRLGFNVSHSIYGMRESAAMLSDAGLRPFAATNQDLGNQFHVADPALAIERWGKFKEHVLGPALATQEGKKLYQNLAYFGISDEIACTGFAEVEPAKVNAWFRAYLRDWGVADADLGRPMSEAEFPLATMYIKGMPREGDLPTRKLAYHAAKFGQWWSAKQLRQSSDLIKGSLPAMKTQAMPCDHPFLGSWGPPLFLGMSPNLLDFFELGRQRSVDQLAVELDRPQPHVWPECHWTGHKPRLLHRRLAPAAQRAPAQQPIALGSFITPSDDRYLRLKAYSGLGQGLKSFYYWDYGPTYLATENYWSDLRSQYDGIAKVNRALEKSEEVLYPAQPVRDPVAILYSVSHDYWHTDDPAAFVEKRLLWHALRHLHVQPDFLREEEVAAGELKNYKVLYIADWCVSRKASAAIDEWVRAGGVLYLSAGAATRDEFYEPYVPAFAADLWPKDAAQRLVSERSAKKEFALGTSHSYNERTDLPTIRPLAKATVNVSDQKFDLPVIGVRLDLLPKVVNPIAVFDDGAPAGAVVAHGRGQVVGLGFLPMLAYGQLAGFKPTTLEEKWPADPRALVSLALDTAKVTPTARASAPVVEVNLLRARRVRLWYSSITRISRSNR
ncbi:MAG: hypothetical protein WKF77_19625 [Planctomycetaceae bacterium]